MKSITDTLSGIVWALTFVHHLRTSALHSALAFVVRDSSHKRCLEKRGSTAIFVGAITACPGVGGTAHRR
jgi:hypothetical protein